MEENTTVDESASTQKTLASHHDPGWNDPPKWALSSTPPTGAAPTKRLLNKRVAFPLTAPGSAPSSTPSPNLCPNLPPPVQSSPLSSAPHAPLSTPTGIVEEAKAQAAAIDRNEVLKETNDNLQAFLSKELSSSSTIEEVRRRLDTMKNMWQENKLKDSICLQVLEISRALKNNDVEAADKIHISLMMENAAICNTWISGIRHMILELRAKSSDRRFSQ